MLEWASNPGDYPLKFIGDTVLFRFSYMTDSIDIDRDGWIIDDIVCMDYWESTTELQNNSMISVYPNPARNNLTISSGLDLETVSIYTLDGQQVSNYLPTSHEINIDISHYKSGIYFVKAISTKGIVANRKILILQ